MPDWLQWINFSDWTPEWVSAAANIIAALGAVGAFTLAIILLRKQYSALDATTKALNDEMMWRHAERERQRREQARMVQLESFEGWVDPADVDAVAELGGEDGIVFVRSRVRVTNTSDARIHSVTVAASPWVPPQLCSVDGEEGVRQDCELPMIPPGKSARFYWVHFKVKDLKTFVDFTDEAGFRWRLHQRDGLSEAAERE